MDTVFNLSKRAFSETEIKHLEKGLGYAPIQKKINEPELKSKLEECCRRMQTKWHFRNEPSEDFCEISSFRLKSSWKPPKVNPNLEMLLNKVEQDLFKTIETLTRYSNLSSYEWKAIISLAGDRSIVVKKNGKGSAVVVWDRVDYIKEAQKQLKDENIYKKVTFKDQNLSELVEKSNHFFKGLKTKGCITDKNLKYFAY